MVVCELQTTPRKAKATTSQKPPKANTARSRQKPKATTSQKPPKAKSHQKPTPAKSQKPPKAKSHQKPKANKSHQPPKAQSHQKPKLTESYQTTNGEQIPKRDANKNPKKIWVPHPGTSWNHHCAGQSPWSFQSSAISPHNGIVHGLQSLEHYPGTAGPMPFGSSCWSSSDWQFAG